jgi:hypothetical protein
MGRCCQIVMGPAGVGKSTYCQILQVSQLEIHSIHGENDSCVILCRIKTDISSHPSSDLRVPTTTVYMDCRSIVRPPGAWSTS